MKPHHVCLAIAVWCVTAASCAAAQYKKVVAITHEGRVPNLAQLQREVAVNYGPDYARKAVAFMRVLQDPKDMATVPAWKQIKVEFDVLYTLQSEGHRHVHTLGKFLNAQGSQQGAAPSLRSGVDHYKLRFRVSRPCYAYAFQVDSTGKIDPFFPNNGILPGGRNPVTPNRVYELPPAPNWAYLDQNVGIEKFYLFLSEERKATLEDLSRYFADAGAKILMKQWTWKVEKKAKVSKPKVEVVEVPDLLASVKQTIVYTRGLGGVRIAPQDYVKPQYGAGQNMPFKPTLHTAAYSEFVQTFWFRHAK